MADKTIIATLQDRHDLAATWTTKNPILHIGEHGYETDTGLYKIGDGVTTWRLLNYSTKALQDEIDDLVNMITTEANTPEINNTASVVTVGKGKDASGAAVDYSTSVIHGFADYKIKGNTVTNLFINGNFSNGTTGVSTDGTIDTTIYHSSPQSLKLDATSSDKSGGRNIAIPNGHMVYISCWVYVQSGTSAVKLTASDFNSSANQVYSIADLSKTNQWQRISLIATSGNGGLKVMPYATMGSIANVDDIVVIDLDANTNTSGLTLADANTRFPYYFDGTVNVGDCRIRNIGKNLARIKTESLTFNGVTVNIDENGYVNVNGTVTSGYVWFKLTNGLSAHSGTPSTSSTPTWFADNLGTGQQIYSISNYSGTSSASLTFRCLLTNDGDASITIPATLYKTFTDNSKNIIIYAGAAGNSYTNVKFRFQLELGSTATAYESYRENMQYIETGIPSRSLPNGVTDVMDSKGNFTQNIKTKVLQSSDMNIIYTDRTNFDYVSINKPTDYIGYGNYSASNGNLTITNYDYMAWGNSANNIGHFSTNAMPTLMEVCFVKGTTLAQAQTALAGLTLIYQLATPIVTQNPGKHAMEVFENGTTIIEPAICNTCIYGTKMTVDNSAYPIKTLESVTKIVTDDNGKHEIPIALSTCTVASDGQSFTSTALSSTDVAEYSYFYDPTPTSLATISAIYPINTKSQIDGNTKAIGDIYGDISDLNEYDSILNDKVTTLSQVATSSTNGLESSAHYTKLEGITATPTELNVLDGVTATTTELNYVDGVTSSIQTQLNSKLSLSGGTLTGKLNLQGTAASIPLQTRNIVGSNGTTTIGELYIQYGANSPIYLGNAGGYSISADGSVYSGTATYADKLDNQHGSYYTNSDNMISGTTNKVYTAIEQTKLSGIAIEANNYSHPTGDGNLHVPATGTTNGGKVLFAAATAGSATWMKLSENDITNLTADLNSKAPLASPSFTGTPKSVTPSVGDNSTNIATTAFYNSQGATALPIADGTATIGSSSRYARQDHVHPTDTSRASTAIATESANGLMSSADKTKLDGLSTGGSSLKSATFVVGTTTNGHTVIDCDYLCDGTDDQVEINTAIEALPTTGGRIIILDGTYDIHSANGVISIGGTNIVIEGMGSGTKLAMGGAMGAIVNISSDYCAIKNLCISSPLDGINITGNHTLIENCNFSGVAGRGIICSRSDCKIINNDFSSCSICIFFSGTTTCNRISGNYMTSFSDTGIYLSGSSKAIVSNNVCDLSSYTSSQYSIHLVSTANNYNLITGNMIYGKDVVSGGGTGNTYTGLNKYN